MIERVNKLLTRKEILEIWNKQNEKLLNTLCCPNCRDLLFDGNSKNVYVCKNCEKIFILED